MLILTIQKQSVTEAMLSGDYTANFYKSTYGCTSPGYTRGYLKIKSELSKKLNRSLLPEDTPIWGWVGIPFIDFHRFDKSEPLIAIFAEIPDDEVVLSDYDMFCDYIEGKSGSSNFILGSEPLKDGVCVQASFLELRAENILLTVRYEFLKQDKSPSRTVERLYNSCTLYDIYLKLNESRKLIKENYCTP